MLSESKKNWDNHGQCSHRTKTTANIEPMEDMLNGRHFNEHCYHMASFTVFYGQHKIFTLSSYILCLLFVWISAKHLFSGQWAFSFTYFVESRNLGHTLFLSVHSHTHKYLLGRLISGLYLFADFNGLLERTTPLASEDTWERFVPILYEKHLFLLASNLLASALLLPVSICGRSQTAEHSYSANTVTQNFNEPRQRDICCGAQIKRTVSVYQGNVCNYCFLLFIHTQLHTLAPTGKDREIFICDK